MAIEILRPNAAGDETNISWQIPESGAHWDKVDDTGAGDGYTTTVFEEVLNHRDLYNLPASSGVGPINKITVYVKAVYYYGGAAGAETWVAMKTGGAVYEGPKIHLTTSWVLYSQEWTTNPQSGAAWTWANINALQIGVRLYGSSDWDEGEEEELFDCPECTQVYVEVDYIPYSDIGIRLRTSSGTIKIGTQALDGHALRIRKGATTYGIPLIATSDDAACGFRIYDGSNVKSIPKVD